MTNNNELAAKLLSRAAGIRLYGFAPPKQTTPPEQLAAIAAQQTERIQSLGVDGVVIYDIQDEAERVTDPRPFPFLPTLNPEDYAYNHLRRLTAPKVVYRCVSRDTPSGFVQWLKSIRNLSRIVVLVGAPSSRSQVSLSLSTAYALVREHAPDLLLGGIAIAERHARNLDEHERILAKTRKGCSFFVTQAVYDLASTKSLLSDYALALGRLNETPRPLILTFSPCGSLKTLAFMKWLGISFPRWLENELQYARDPLEKSVDLCEETFCGAWRYAREKQIPLGINVESVSIRRVEIEASIELFSRLRGHLERT